MTFNARIAFADNSPPSDFEVHAIGKGEEWHWPSFDDRQFSGHTWRLLARDCAVELWPICDHEARLVADKPPVCDRLKIWPVRWGYPDSIVADHPVEVEQMRQDHFAGKHDLINGNYTWQHWLEHYGKADLWAQFRTEEMEKHWLSWRNGPGSTLWIFSGTAGRIRREVLECIKFRADFYSGDTCHTIYLSKCAKSPLLEEERRNSPAHIARLEQLQATVKAAGVATKSLESQLDKIQKFWPDTPAVQRARATIIREGGPEKFVEWVVEQQYITGQWLAGKDALTKCKERGWRGKRGGLSYKSVLRWIDIIRTERKKAGLEIGEGEDAMRHKLRETKVENIKDDLPTPYEAAATAIDGPTDNDSAD